MASRNGKVFSTITNRFISFYLRRGYPRVRFHIAGVVFHRSLHRIIAKTFIPNPNGYPQINHKDGNKLNNKVNNLEWATSKMNVHHSHRLGLANCIWGEKQGHSKLFNKDVVKIRKLIAKGYNNAEIGRLYNANKNTIRSIRLGLSWFNLV